MKPILILGLCLVAGAELLVLLGHSRRFVLLIPGIAVAVLLISLRRLMVHDAETNPGTTASGISDTLGRWQASTEHLIHWSETTRKDWDRHWRPMLARRFENVTGQSHGKDSAAFNATGRMLFGVQLWAWVDPNNVADGADREPGPGRAALDDILQRLEQA
jgi:hypothetical protein